MLHPQSPILHTNTLFKNPVLLLEKNIHSYSTLELRAWQGENIKWNKLKRALTRWCEVERNREAWLAETAANQNQLSLVKTLIGG